MNNQSQKIIYFSPDYQFAVEFTAEDPATACCVNFRIAECDGSAESGFGNWEGNDIARSLSQDDAEYGFAEGLIMEGSVKWDSCMNFQVPAWMHMCGPSSILQDIITAIYTQAPALMPKTWDAHCADPLPVVLTASEAEELREKAWKYDQLNK